MRSRKNFSGIILKHTPGNNRPTLPFLWLAEAWEQNYRLNFSVRFFALYSISLKRILKIWYLRETKIYNKQTIRDSDTTLSDVGAQEHPELLGVTSSKVFLSGCDGGVQHNYLDEILPESLDDHITHVHDLLVAG